MDLNGNAITVSNALYERMAEADPEAMSERPISARALRRVIELDRAAGRPPLIFAQVFPYSTHNYQLRYWMASAGIDPDRDLRLIVIPPPQMATSLATHDIDGYCVGEPWNAHAVQQGIGRALITSYELWNNAPEKVFGVTRRWAENHPETHIAVIEALLEAARWMDRPENRMEVVETLTRGGYIDAPLEVVQMSMTGTFRYATGEPASPLPDFNVFHRYAANFPWRSHAEWLVSQMYRWGQIDRAIAVRPAIAEIYRPDIFRTAADRLGVPYPRVDHKVEGVHAQGWTLEAATAPIAMGPDRFFDGRRFDPEALVDYVAGFEVHALRMDLAELAAANS
jgi:nitrate/nitrite transport system substrate-binding protein